MPDQEFYKFFDDYLEEHLRQCPVHASQLGDHRYDDQIEDLSVEARQNRIPPSPLLAAVSPALVRKHVSPEALAAALRADASSWAMASSSAKPPFATP